MKVIRSHITNKTSIIHVPAVTIDSKFVVVTCIDNLEAVIAETEIKAATTTKNTNYPHLDFRRSV